MTAPVITELASSAAHDGDIPRALLTRPRSMMPIALVYVALAISTSTAFWLVISGAVPSASWGAMFLFGSAIIGTRLELSISELASVTSESIPVIVGIILFPSLAPVFGMVMAFGSFPNRMSRALSTSTCVIGSVAAGAAVLASQQAHEPSAIIFTALVSSLLFSGVNALMVGFGVSVYEGTSLRSNLPMIFGTTAASTLLLFPVTALIVAAHREYGFWVLPVVVIPLFLVQYFHGLYHKKALLTKDLAATNEKLARSNLQFAAAMVRALDARDAYTAGHSAAVAVYSRDIAREAGFDDHTVRMAHLAGLLHDIGKIGVRGSILNKTAPLDDDEYEAMKEHARIGAEILAEVDAYAEISTYVRYHHERMDGRGYPEGIGGDAIPAISRMISVADTYSALTTDRPYRDGMPTEKAMKILGEASGSGQLDEMFTAVFLRILRSADDEYQRGKQSSFDVEIARHEALVHFTPEATTDFDPRPAIEPGTQAA